LANTKAVVDTHNDRTAGVQMDQARDGEVALQVMAMTPRVAFPDSDGRIIFIHNG